MKLTYISNEEKLVLRISGEIDHHGAKNAISEINEKIESIMPRECTLDLSGVTFMDSSGIAVILIAHRRISEIGGRLVIKNIPPQARRVLKASGIGKTVNFQEA